MNFNDHSNLIGGHAPFSPSQGAWVNYNDEKFIEVFKNLKAKEIGTRLHEIAAQDIKYKLKRPNTKQSFNSYINDAIGYRMTPEQVLYYSSNFWGTTDAINFNEKKGFLRIHDYKSGRIPASMRQLIIYAALFCLEYGINPADIESELRIYQNDDIILANPEPEEVKTIMDKIVHFNTLIQDIEGMS